MTSFNQLILFPLLTSFIITALSTPIALYFLKKFGVLDDPKLHKHPAIIHKIPIPRGGGIPMFLGVFIAVLVFLPMSKIIIALILASSIALIIGVIDDKKDLSPYFRFVINIVCALIVVWGGANIPFITNPLGGILFLSSIHIPYLSYIIAIVWIVWIMNMLNWSKGVDGQMPGVVAISAIVIGILSLRFSGFDIFTHISATLSFIIAGSALGFLMFNFYPAKIFPGYGATAIYLLLAVVSILSSAKLATAILVMGVPMIDGVFTIGRRILTGHSPFRHDKRHLHHLLLDLGFGQRRIALFYWTLSAILGSLSLFLSSKGKLFAILMLIIVVGGVLLSLQFLTKKGNDKTYL